MGQNMSEERPPVRARESTREIILRWMDSYDIDGDNEAADCLVRRIHAATFPFDADPGTLLDSLVAAIHWQADRIDGDRNTADLFLRAAEQVDDAFSEAGLIDERSRVEETAPDAVGDNRSRSAEAEQRDGKRAEEESASTPDDAPPPMRRDLIYDTAVEVRLADGSRGLVARPPFFGRVRMTPAEGRSRIVPVDDLCQASLRALRLARVRRRVEVHAWCSFWQGCSERIRTYLTEDQRVENAAGKAACGFDGLFLCLCPKHLRDVSM